jgi:hypothetical protein
LPNHRSFEQNEQFGREAVSKLHACGAAKKWPFPWPPRVVLPLGVAIVEGRKPRLVLDGGYTNLFCRYRQFRYEPVRHAASRQYGCWYSRGCVKPMR